MDPSAPGGPNNGYALTKGMALSNAMRNSKRLLAGVAVAGLTAALLPMISVGTANAAVPPGALALQSQGARAGTTFTATYTTTSAAVSGDFVCLTALSGPVGSTFTAGSGVAADTTADGGTVTLSGLNANIAGTYQVGVYTGTSGACQSFTTQAIVATGSLVIGGEVATIAVTPATATAATASATTFTITAQDSAGRTTLFGAANPGNDDSVGTFDADNYTLTSSIPSTVGFNGASNATQTSQTARTFTAQNSAAGIATITITPNDGAVAPKTAVLTTITSGNATAVTVAAPDTAIGTAPNFEVPAGTNSVTFSVAGTVGQTVAYTIGGTGADAAVSTGTVNSLGYFTVTVPVTNSAVGRTVTITPNGLATQTVTQTASIAALALPSVVTAKPGGTVSISGIVEDQFGLPLANSAVTGSYATTSGAGGSGATTAALTNTDGLFTLTYTAASTTTTSTVQSASISANAGAAGTASGSVTVTFTATGASTLSNLVLGSSAVTPANFASTVQVPFGGFVNTAVSGTTSGTATGNAVQLGVTSSAGNVNVTYSATAGGKFRTSVSSTALWSSGSATLTVPASTAVYFFSTKTGKNTVSVTAGDNTLSADITVGSPAAAARNVALSPATQTNPAAEIVPVTLTVTDVFGNGVAGANNISVAVTGEGFLNGFNKVLTPNATGTDGTTVFTYVSQVQGEATLTATGLTGSQFGAGNGAGFIGGVPVAGAPASVSTADAKVITRGGAGAKSITIAGARGTVSGKPGVIIDGVVTGIANGKTVKPFFRFPGQTSFTEGSARPEINNGTFQWQRKTGKKFYAYVTSDDGLVQSNRVIIAAN